MKNRIFLIILTFLMAALIGCSGSDKTSKFDKASFTENNDSLKAHFVQNIHDPGRLDKLSKLLDESELIILDFADNYHVSKNELTKLSSNYATTKDELKTAADSFDKKYENFVRAIFSNRMEMRKIVTHDEWDDLWKKIKITAL